MNTHVALLRGINVGGKNKLPMVDLVAMFEAAGGTAVRTYIQSGNVVFEADDGVAGTIPMSIQRAIEARFGHSVPVVTRTADALAAAVAGNPYAEGDFEASRLSVGFLADRPDAARVAALDPDRSPPDTFAIVGQEIYLHCPNGVARSKLTNAYFDRVLGTVSTFRNWRTTSKLLDMVGRG